MTRQIFYSLRTLFKYPVYTVISVIGMGTAMAICLLIGNYVISNYNYDAFHEHGKNIYRLTMEVTTGDGTEHFANTGRPLGKLLMEQFSAVKSSAQLAPYYDAQVKVKDEMFAEKGFYATNTETLDVFTFRFHRGNRASCFSQPNTVLLTKSTAKKYFNSIEVVGETLLIEDEEYLVSAVIEDWPRNSHLPVNALLYRGEGANIHELQDWFNMDYYTYILLDEKSNQTALTSSLKQLTNKQITPHLEGSGVSIAFRAQPLKGLYFEKGLIGDLPKGNKIYVNALGMAAILILILSCFNYINLTLTQSVRRSKEISIKKTLGISRKQLVFQFMLESLLMTFLFLAVAAMLIIAFAGLYMQYTGLSITDLYTGRSVLAGILAVSLVSGLFGNSYSVGYLTFSRMLNKANEKLSVNQFKNVLVGFQFGIASMMIMAILTMNKQISFMQNKGLGFSKEGIAIVKLPEGETLKNKFIAFREKLSNQTMIEQASLIGGGALPGEDNGKEIFQVIQDGKTLDKIYNLYRIDEAYFNLLNIQLAGGRNFDKNRPSDTVASVIINEMLTRSLNWTDPLGKEIIYGNGGKPRKVIGVVKNFHNQSLHHVIEPIVFIYDENYSSNLLVKTRASDIDLLKAAWKDFFPDKQFSVTFFDEFLKVQYLKEVKLSRLLGLFSILAVIISAMGLFAMFSLNITQKIKEISIRKVLGANLVDLMSMITRKYFVIILIATGLTIPVSWYTMNYWLSSFAFRVDIHPIIFALSAVIIMLVCLITVLHHMYRIFHVNPAKTLKDE